MQNEEFMSSVHQALHEYKEGMGHFSDQMPDVAEKYHAFTKICFQEGHLAEKYKQLIALALAMNAQDEYCMIYHVNEALHKGATRDEILEAVAVSGAFGGGAALSQGVTVVEEALRELDGKPLS